jgi:hypothetical protein
VENMSEKMYIKGVEEFFDGEIILGSDCMKFNLNPK